MNTPHLLHAYNHSYHTPAICRVLRVPYLLILQKCQADVTILGNNNTQDVAGISKQCAIAILGGNYNIHSGLKGNLFYVQI